MSDDAQAEDPSAAWLLEDPQARFEVHMDRHWSTYLAVATTCVRGRFGRDLPEFAHDVALNAAKTLASKLKSRDEAFAEVRNVEAWMRGVIERKARKAFTAWLRERRRTVNLAGDELLPAAVDMSMLSYGHGEEVGTALAKMRDCLANLTSQQQQIMQVKIANLDEPGFGNQDIATICSTTLRTVEAQISQAYARLRACMQRKGVVL